MCQELPLHVPPRGVLADMASSASTPLQYEFVNGESNNMNTSGAQPRILEGALPPLPLLDPLHYRYIAPQEPKFNCTRCCSVRASWWGDSESVWDHHWASNCICSGHWAQPSTSPPNAA